MAEIIRATPRKRKTVITESVQAVEAPNLSKLNSAQFNSEAVDTLEERLLQIGVIIPKARLKRLAPALVTIGKKYYELTAQPKSLF